MITEVLAYLGMVSPILLIVFIWHTHRVLKRLAEIERQATQAVPYWQWLLKRLSRDLEANAPADIAALLAQVKQGPSLAEADEQALLSWLDKQSRNAALSKADRCKASALPLVLEEARHEQEDDAPAQRIQLVSLKH